MKMQNYHSPIHREKRKQVMARKILYSFLPLLVLYLPASSFAETIILRSGQTIEGRIIEKADQYLKIDFEGVSLTYYYEDIESIDGKKVVLPSLKENLAPQPLYKKEDTIKNLSEGKYYINHEYGIKIWHPNDWEVFDRNIHPEVFKRLLVKPTFAVPNLICALSCGKDWSNLGDNLEPLILVTIDQMSEDVKDLSLEELANLMYQSSQQSSVPPGHSLIEKHSVVTINGKKFIKLITLVDLPGYKTKGKNYVFTKGTSLYGISCSAGTQIFDKYDTVFERIVGSTEVN